VTLELEPRTSINRGEPGRKSGNKGGRGGDCG